MGQVVYPDWCGIDRYVVSPVVFLIVTWSHVTLAVTWSCNRILDVALDVAWSCNRIQDVALDVAWSCNGIRDVALDVAGARDVAVACFGTLRGMLRGHVW